MNIRPVLLVVGLVGLSPGATHDRYFGAPAEAGHLVEAPDAMIWDLDPPDSAWAEEIQGFRWLDDLAAVGDARARQVAQRWLWGWIDRYGTGKGDGWTPEAARSQCAAAPEAAFSAARCPLEEDMGRIYQSAGLRALGGSYHAGRRGGSPASTAMTSEITMTSNIAARRGRTFFASAVPGATKCV